MALTTAAVIPLYNKPKSIGRAIRSIYTQTQRPHEVIVVNDGSTDESLAVVKALNYSGLRIISVPNGGEASARNIGIKATAAEVVLFLDADDEWKPTFVARILSLFSDFPHAGAAATAYEYRLPSGRVFLPELASVIENGERGTIPDYFQACLGQPPVTSSSVGIRRSVCEAVGYFPQVYPRGMDLAMWTKIAFTYPIAFDTRVCAVYHLDAENRVCNRSFAERQHYAVDLINAHLERAALSDAKRASLLAYRSRLMIDVARQNLFGGRPLIARTLIDAYDSAPAFRRKARSLRLLTYCPALLFRALWSIKTTYRLSLPRRAPKRRAMTPNTHTP